VIQGKRIEMFSNIIENVSCPDDGYRALAAAVVWRARQDFRPPGSRRLKKEAREWLLSDRCADWLGFMNLTVDSSQIEKWIFRETEDGEEI
jgi:hypothetical protein